MFVARALTEWNHWMDSRRTTINKYNNKQRMFSARKVAPRTHRLGSVLDLLVFVREQHDNNNYTNPP